MRTIKVSGVKVKIYGESKRYTWPKDCVKGSSSKRGAAFMFTDRQENLREGAKNEKEG